MLTATADSAIIHLKFQQTLFFMKTKHLLSMAAVAASIFASNLYANTYSVNIPKGWSMQSNPLINGANTADIVILNPGGVPWDGSILAVWNGIGFTLYKFNHTKGTGFTNLAGTTVPAPVLSPGLGWIINNKSGSPQTILYSGTPVGPTSTIYPVSARPYAVGSPNWLQGGVSSVLGFSNPNTVQQGTYSGPLDNSILEFLDTSSDNLSAWLGGNTQDLWQGGSVKGFYVAYFDSETSDTTTGFVNGQSDPILEPTVLFGGGFFFSCQPNGEGSTDYTWINP